MKIVTVSAREQIIELEIEDAVAMWECGHLERASNESGNQKFLALMMLPGSGVSNSAEEDDQGCFD